MDPTQCRPPLFFGHEQVEWEIAVDELDCHPNQWLSFGAFCDHHGIVVTHRGRIYINGDLQVAIAHQLGQHLGHGAVSIATTFW